MFRNFYSLLKINEFSKREFLTHTWNNGKVEWWNDGNSPSTEWIRSEFFISFMVCRLDFHKNPFRQSPQTPGPARLLIVFVLQWLNLKMRPTIFYTNEVAPPDPVSVSGRGGRAIIPVPLKRDSIIPIGAKPLSSIDVVCFFKKSGQNPWQKKNRGIND